jgi:hypothetical protein
MQFSHPPSDWVSFDIQVPVEAKDHEMADMGYSMINLKPPEHLDDLVDLTSNYLEREVSID